MISPIGTRYGVDYCTLCDHTLAYCRCPATAAAKEYAGRLAVLAQLNPGVDYSGMWREYCNRCGRLAAECNKDAAGCGSGRAGDKG